MFGFGKKKKEEAKKEAREEDTKNSGATDSISIETIDTKEVSRKSGDDIDGGHLSQDKKDIDSFTKKQIVEAEKEFQKGTVIIRDIIAPSALQINFDHLLLENKYVRTMYVITYPRYLYTNWLAPIINYDVSLDVSLFIVPQDNAEMMKFLQKKAGEIGSQLRIDYEKGKPRDPEREIALQDVEELRDKLASGQNKLFHSALYFTIFADSLDELNVLTKRLETNLAGNLIYQKPASLRMEDGLTSTLPLCLDELGIYRNMDTEALSTFFLLSSSDLTQNKGVLYGINMHNNGLVLFDRYSMQNANMVVFATSGAGKSYTVKVEIIRQLMFGTEVFIIDPEGEYKLISENLGGSYIKISLNSTSRINPFDLPEAVDDEDVSAMRASIVALQGLLKVMMGDMSPLEGSILDKALYDTYASAGITDDPDTHSRPMPTMENLQRILAQTVGGENMAAKLEKYTTGSFAGLFNQPTNVDLGRQLVVFDTRDLEDVLRPVGMYVVLNYIWNQVKRERKRRMLAVDEAWILMQYEESAKFMFSVAKRARKYWLGLTTISQDVNDFLGNKYGKSVVTNSAIQLLLRQSTAAIDHLQDIFKLTQREKEFLLSAETGTGLFFAGQAHVAVQILANYLEHQLVTTNPQELAQRGII